MIEELLDKFKDNQNYFLRIRKLGESGEELLVYYYGIEVFKIVNNNGEEHFYLKANTFKPNSKNGGKKNIPAKVQGEIEKVKKMGFSLDVTKDQDYVSWEKFNVSELDSLCTIVQERVNIYTNKKTDPDDYQYSKTDNNQEKQFQQNLMNKYKTLTNLKKEFSNREILPFEMEYTMYASLKTAKKGEDKYRERANVKGRIDNIFVTKDVSEVILVELKYGTSVIGQTNGIHKHLLDLATILDKNDKIKEDLKNHIQERYDILKKYNLLDNYNFNLSNSCVKDDFKLKYYIICGSNDEGKEEKALLDFLKNKKIDSYEVYHGKIVEKVKEKSLKGKGYNEYKDKLHKKDPKNSANCYEPKLLDKTIKEYVDYIGNRCEIKIFLTDFNYEKLIPYSYK